MENEEMDFEEFFSAFGDTGEDDSNQTGPETEHGEEETIQEPTASQESGENSSEENASEQGEKPTEGSEEPSGTTGPQKFTIKVNKGTREVELPEMTELAQKGADYDRVKGQLETSRSNEANLQKMVDEQSPIIEVLQLAAQDAGVDMSSLVESIHIGLLQGKGMTEAEAKAEIRAAKAEKAVNDLKNKPAEEKTEPKPDSAQERAKREIAEFQTAFPGVQLTQDIIGKLAPDVQGGMTLTTAYLKMENARLTTELAEQTRKLEAEKQNQKNRRQAAPGQTDSGGGREKDPFDAFFSEFEK